MEFEAGEIVWPSTTPQALNPTALRGLTGPPLATFTAKTTVDCLVVAMPTAMTREGQSHILNPRS